MTLNKALINNVTQIEEQIC